MIALQMRGVGVAAGDRPLLEGVDWQVNAGERWVVLGPNGAGKTTLVRVAAGDVSADTGTVALLGEDLAQADLEDLLPRVGWSSAAIADVIPPRERVLDVVMTAAYAVVGRGAEDYDNTDAGRARMLLLQLGCRELADRAYGTLSEGERKRVQIARALMADPELLVLDEPAAGLDLGGREALLRRLTRLARDPRAPTLILVTHHVEEIPVGCTHALLLRAGRVVAQGPLAAVMTSGTLSRAFGLPLAVDEADGRYTARALLGRT